MKICPNCADILYPFIGVKLKKKWQENIIYDKNGRVFEVNCKCKNCKKKFAFKNKSEVPKRCPICNSEDFGIVKTWYYICPRCGKKY